MRHFLPAKRTLPNSDFYKHLAPTEPGCAPTSNETITLAGCAPLSLNVLRPRISSRRLRYAVADGFVLEVTDRLHKQ